MKFFGMNAADAFILRGPTLFVFSWSSMAALSCRLWTQVVKLARRCLSGGNHVFYRVTVQPTNMALPFHLPLGGGLSNQGKQALKILVWAEDEDWLGFLVCERAADRDTIQGSLTLSLLPPLCGG